MIKFLTIYIAIGAAFNMLFMLDYDYKHKVKETIERSNLYKTSGSFAYAVGFLYLCAIYPVSACRAVKEKLK